MSGNGELLAFGKEWEGVRGWARGRGRGMAE